MIYSFKLIFWGIVFVLPFFWILKKNRQKKIAIILTLVFWIVLGIVSSFFPPENLFINFRNPKDVFDYYYQYQKFGDIYDIIYGNNSCMVLYKRTENLTGYFIIPKSAKGYKIPGLLFDKIVYRKIDMDGAYLVYNVIGTKDYYITGSTFSEENEINIVDNNNKEVKKIVEGTPIMDIKTIRLYIFVDDFTNEYFIRINGKKILFSKSSMGRLQIANENRATYELFSNTRIPKVIKDLLTNKGIPFIEILN